MALRREKGSALAEVVVVAAILSVVALAFLGTFALLSRSHERNMLSIKGELLAEEGIEALRFIKSGGWDALATIPPGTPRYLSLSISSWGVTTTPEVIDGEFHRSFRVYQVARDAGDDIVSSGGIMDADTLRLVSTVEWSSRGASTTAEYEIYITNIE